MIKMVNSQPIINNTIPTIPVSILNGSLLD